LQMPYAVKKVLNIAYGPDSAQKMDRYSPIGLSGRLPTVAMVIGGGFATADAADRAKWDGMCNYLAGLGYNAFTVGYRGTPTNYYPDTMADVRLALSEIQARSFVDPARVCAWGRSAGSFMCAWMGIEQRVKIAIGECGPYTLSGPLPWLNGADHVAASPRFNVAPTTRQMMLVHGTADTVVPHQASVDMADALAVVGVPCLLRLHTGKHGTIDYSTPTGAAIRNEQVAFLSANL